ncbi:hypothetical protein ACA910_016842 [Epithemia clementina (nom. ined.)]
MKSISHALSWALRHGAMELRLRITSDGYCPVQDLIEHSHPKLKKLTSLDQIRPIVETSDKQRFRLELRPANLYYSQQPQTINHHSEEAWSVIALTPEQAAPAAATMAQSQQQLLEHTENGGGGDTSAPSTESNVETATNMNLAQQLAAAETNGLIWCIRANQGHSLEGINPDYLLEEIPADALATLPVIVHGTYFDAWRKIQSSGGISRMGRTHIHFAPGLPGDNGVVSGMRASSEVYIYINGAKCAADGIRFHRSDNGVLLTAGQNDDGTLPLEFISHVQDRSGKMLLDQRNK